MQVHGEVQLTGSNVAQNRMAFLISEPVLLSIPTYEGSGQAVHPKVVRIPGRWNNYEYWMAFTPYPNSNTAHENPSIIASNDGINWVVPAGLTNPLFGPPGSGFYADPELVYDWQNNKLLLWYSHYDGATSKSFYSESLNGVNWSAPVQTNITMGACGVVKTDTNKLEVWQLTGSGIEAAFKFKSTDGITWFDTHEAISWHSGNHYHATVLRDAAGFHFLSASHFINTSAGNNRPNDLMYGYSRDGKAIVFDTVPLIQKGTAPWMSKRLYHSCLVPLGGDEYRAYVSAEATDGKWSICYVDIRLNNPGGREPVQYPNIRTLFDALAVRDTVDKIAYATGAMQGFPDWQVYKNKVLVIHSTLDQPIDLRLTADFINGAATFNTLWGGVAQAEQKVTLPVGNNFKPYYLTATDIPALAQILPTHVGLRLKAAVAPTNGTITVKLISWN